MHGINQQISEAFLNTQLLQNRDRIKSLNALLRGKNRSSIADDMVLFEKFNEIAFEHQRVFPYYHPQERVVESKDSLATILTRIGKKTLRSYCDVGCGMGFYPRAAFEMGCPSCLGIDIIENEQWGRYAETTAGKLRYMRADISSADHFEERYELVTSFAAFEHFADPPGMLRALSGLVQKGGYLYLIFGPIYYSTDGHHMYRDIQIPWYHLLFTEKICNQYPAEESKSLDIDKLYFNKWSAYDYLMMFTNFTDMRILKINTLWNLHHYWFSKMFPQFLPQYGIEELMIGGFEVFLYKD